MIANCQSGHSSVDWTIGAMSHSIAQCDIAQLPNQYPDWQLAIIKWTGP
jgi:hypothetical protein